MPLLQSSQSRTANSKACRDSGDNRFSVLCISPIFAHSQKYIHGLYTCVPSCLSSVSTETCSFLYIDKYYICFTSDSVLITIHPFSKNLGSPTILPSYLLRLKAATSLNKYLFVHLCLHFLHNTFYVVSSFFPLNPL